MFLFDGNVFILLRQDFTHIEVIVDTKENLFPALRLASLWIKVLANFKPEVGNRFSAFMAMRSRKNAR